MMVRASVTVVAELEDTISFHPDDKSVCKLGSLVEELELAAPKLRFGLGSDSESSRRIRSLNPGESNLNVDLGRKRLSANKVVLAFCFGAFLALT